MKIYLYSFIEITLAGFPITFDLFFTDFKTTDPDEIKEFLPIVIFFEGKTEPTPIKTLSSQVILAPITELPPIKFRIDCRVTCFDDELANVSEGPYMFVEVTLKCCLFRPRKGLKLVCNVANVDYNFVECLFMENFLYGEYLVG